MEGILEALGINGWTFLLQAINVLVVLGVLYLLLWKPLNQALLSREEKIKGDFKDAASIRKEADEILASYKQQLGQAQRESEAILQRANEMAGATRSEAADQAKEETARALEQARLEIEKEKKLAIAAIRSQVADIVVVVTNKVLARTLSVKDQEYLLQEALTEVERLQ
ncbi:MAG: F0F1 ATP synthase subunit B [Dethiobacteria bacterium]|jgi:F-type H+-transporting ATPase subunit b